MLFFWQICSFLFFLLVSSCAIAAGVPYTVDFEGLDDPLAIKTIKSISQLTSLKKRPPASINALRYRAESDIPELLKILRAHGYYEAKVEVRLEERADKIRVIVTFDPGPAYLLDRYEIHLYSGPEKTPVECKKITLKELGISLREQAFAQKIIASELHLLRLLSDCGYPLAEIEKREVVVNGESKDLRVCLEIQTGPLSHFGPLKIEGATDVSSRFIQQKLLWKEGQVYDSTLVERTQKSLMDSALFSSLLITHDKTLDEKGELPMRIEIAENKHKSINIGASYQTFYGPGITFGWENRNINHMGRKLSLQGDITKRSHSGMATYLFPDFHRKGQDYIWQAQAMHESITPYSMRTYNLTNRLERKLGKRMWFSIGGRIERLYVTNSVQNGNFVLLEFPLYLRWSSANSLLNPTRGIAFEYKLTPTLNFTAPSNLYLTHTFTQSYYYPVGENESLVLAQKIMIDASLSKSLSTIPVPMRFFGGSEEELRGYRYRSVSPLEHHHKPIGGGSAIFYTLETRFRVSELIGLVPFFDLGSVYSTQLPRLKGKWFKSVGLGFRYFSFIGPIRLDVGFPLDRRKDLDPVYRVLVSIGQMF